MNAVITSDTHGYEFIPEPADIFIHCGDFTYHGTPSEIDKQILWLKSIRDRFKYMICIPGNHDFMLESCLQSMYKKIFLSFGAYLLIDEAVHVDGKIFYGAPWIPSKGNWAFSIHPNEISSKWNSIPYLTDILITHTPPIDILDKNDIDDHCGCKALNKRIENLKLKYHLFGHIHESQGIKKDKITYINASYTESNYYPTSKYIRIKDKCIELKSI